MENKNPQIDKWKRLAKRFGFLWLSAVITFVIVTVVANQMVATTHTTQSWAIAVSIGLGVVSAVGILGLLFSLIALSIAKRRARREEVSKNGTKPEKTALAGWHIRKKPLFAGIVLLLLMALGIYSVNYFVPKNCQYADCLVFAANDGKAANFQSTDEAGIEWSYQIKRGLWGDLTFIKTLVRLDDKESPQIKEFLEGKSLTCDLDGNFDKRLITSLFHGIGDNCSGELKENLGQLLFLSQ